MKKGDFYYIPANVPHSDKCIGRMPSVMLDIFYPTCEDLVQKFGRR